MGGASGLLASYFWFWQDFATGQFRLDFRDGRQAALEFLGQGFGELGLPGGDGDGLIEATEGVLDDEAVFALA